jgi:hypothetical protein
VLGGKPAVVEARVSIGTEDVRVLRFPLLAKECKLFHVHGRDAATKVLGQDRNWLECEVIPVGRIADDVFQDLAAVAADVDAVGNRIAARRLEEAGGARYRVYLGAVGAESAPGWPSLAALASHAGLVA